jgi:hypothetical protein
MKKKKKKKTKTKKEFMGLKGQDRLNGGKRSERGKDPVFSLWNVGNSLL